MTSTTANISPQTNLKDRIAALQRLNHQNATTVNSSTAASIAAGAQSTPSRASLRDKIAKFERRGGTPIPRGSFGLGAPPPDDGASKKNGELYGNRVPGLNRPTGPPSTFAKPLSPPPSFSNPSFPRKRSLSASGLDFLSRETGSDIAPDLISPINPAPVLEKGSDEAAADDSSSLKNDDLGRRPVTSPSRRSSVAFGRRVVSDVFNASGISGQVRREDEPSEPEVVDRPSVANEDVIEESLPSAREPDTDVLVQVPAQEDKVADISEPLAVDSVATSIEASPVQFDAPKVSSEDSHSSSTLVNNLEQVTPPSVATKFSRRPSATISKIPVRPAQTRLKHDDVEIIVRDSVTNVVQTAADSTTTVSSKSVGTGVSTISEGVPGVGVSGIPSLSLTQNSRAEPTVPMASTHPLPSDSKPSGDLQSKLRKKTYTNSGQSSQEPSLTPKAGRKSFTAVVHRKTDEVPSAKTLDTPGADPVAPVPPGRVKTLARKESSALPSLANGELALLVAEAALLERQLGADIYSGDSAELNHSVPLFTRPTPTSQSSSPRAQGSVRHEVSSDNADPMRSTQSIPYSVPTLRELGEDDEADLVPSSPEVKSRSRKLSNRIKSLASVSSNTLRSLASSTYSRPSMSSELSWEDPTRGSSPLPSTPREDNSIGGSSGSSFKWTSPKRNPLSRASSFADKIMNRAGKAKSLAEDSAVDKNHLSPSRASTFSRSRESFEKSRSLSSHPSSPRLRLPDFSGPSPVASPSSAKVSSTPMTASPTNIRLFDLFDTFPSVPEHSPSLSVSHPASMSSPSNTTTRSSSQTIRNS